MATFSYRIRTTKKSALTKVYIRFNVDRKTSFYAETQYLVFSGAWDDKKQTVKNRYAFTDDDSSASDQKQLAKWRKTPNMR